MTSEEYSSGPLDVPTLDVMAQRAVTHPLVDGWAFQPDTMSPRRLELYLDEWMGDSTLGHHVERRDVEWPA